MNKSKAEKKFGLTLEEIRYLKGWYVKTQDFETASLWREMERAIVPLTKKEVERLEMLSRLSLVAETVFPSYIEKYGDKNFFQEYLKPAAIATKALPKGWSVNESNIKS